MPMDRDFLAGGGEMGARMRAHDWSTSPLGQPETWPQPLRTLVRLMLNAKQAMFIAWGPELAFLYNDDYAPIFGAKHPHALGCPFAEVWVDIWEQIKPLVDQTLSGQSSWHEDLLIPMERNGYREDAWFSFSYNPVWDESGLIAGMFCACTETTDKILGQRALRQSEERAQGVLNGMDEAFVLLDREFRVLQINPAALRLETLSEAEIIGRTHWDVWPDTENSPIGDFYRRAMAERVPMAFENRYVWPHGREAWVEIHAFPAPDGLAVFYRDITERKQAESRLQEAEDHYRHTVELNPQVPWTCDPQGNITSYSPRWLEMTGQAPNEPYGSGWAKAMHPDDVASTLEIFSASLSSGDAVDVEYRIRIAATGEYRWMRARAYPRRDDRAEIIRWYGVVEDIHDRKIAEQSLKESEARLREQHARLITLIDSLPVGVCFIDVEGQSLLSNPAFRRFIPDGTLPSRLPDAEKKWIAYGPDGRKLLRHEFPAPRALRGETVPDTEFLHYSDDGRETWTRFSSVPLRNQAGEVDGAILVIVDIDEQKRAQDLLRKLNENLEAQVEERTRERDQIWHLSTDLMDVCRSDGTLVAVNPAWTTMLGWTEEELLSRNFLKLIHPDDVAATLAELSRLDEGVRTYRFENRFQAKDGSYRLISWTAVPKEGLFYAIGRDITAEREATETLRQTEEALRQSQKMEAVGQLTGGIAHDFNNLLTGIVGSLDMLRTRIAQGRLDTVDRYMTAATTSANRASALTHRLLAFARRQPLDPRPVQANALVASLEDLFRRTVGETVTLEVVLAGGLWPTLCDPNQLESALLNLVINARDAMPDGGKLTIETCNAHLDDTYIAAQRDVKPGQYICICVTDTGTGMPQDVIERAFDPFFTTKPIGQGTGLGLSMVYGFAKQSEGHAKIYSEVGQGTTIKIYLPRYRGETEAEIEAATLAEAPRAESGETVLVVEDEPVVRSLVVEVLEDLGYRTLEAADGPEGLKLLQSRRRIDLLITDVGLPGLNGRQLADAAREKRPDLKVLFITGYAENATLAAGFLEPGMQMITKPFAVDALAQKIRSIIKEA
jgi:PAS domain S-box-containing protein